MANPKQFLTGLITKTFKLTGGTPGAGKILTSDATGNGTWEDAPSGSGDVVGPASATDNVVAVFDGTTGKLIKEANSGATKINGYSYLEATGFTTNVAIETDVITERRAGFGVTVDGALIKDGFIASTAVPTLNQNTTGSAASLTTARTIGTLTGDVTSAGSTFNGTANNTNSTTVTKINGVSLAGLATGILKNTTTTGVPSIAVAGDFPTLNQNTTGSAATLTTPRTFRTNLASTSTASFDGSANVTPGVTGTLPVANGGTGATTLAGAGIVSGPASATSTAIATYNGTTGKTIQNTDLLYNQTTGVISNSGDITLEAGAASTANVKGTAVNLDYGVGGLAFAGTTKSIPSGSFVGTTDTQTLTNKTIDGSNNTVTNIGSNSLVEAFIRGRKQDNTTNSTVTGMSLQHGWGFIQGNGTLILEKTVTFPVAFSSAPVIFITALSAAPTSGGTPSSTSAFTVGWSSATGTLSEDITTSNFEVNLLASSNHSSSFYFGFSWLALGVV